MSIFAIIPVKTLLKSKIRLSTVLGQPERQVFTLAMLEDVLKAVKCSEVHQTVLVSSDSVVKKIAHEFKVMFLQEKMQGLNKAVNQATRWCLQKNAESVLILPADIPLLKPEDVNKMVRLGSEETSVVVFSPSKNGGTNALLLKPPNIIQPRFGPNSFRKHLNEASALKVPSKIYLSKRVSLDIDTVDDLKLLLKTEENTSSHKFLKSININMRHRS